MGKSSRRKKQTEDTVELTATGSLHEIKDTVLPPGAGGRMIPLLIIAAVGLIAFSNTFSVPFVFDDSIQISTNPMIKDLGNFTRYLHDRTFNVPEGYSFFSPSRVAGYLTFALNYAAGRLDVKGYHIFNLAVHISNAMLVYLLVALTFRTPYFRRETLDVRRETTGNLIHETIVDSRGSDDSRFTIHDSRSFIALFAALLFVSHPIQTQAVTYIVQRFASLATMFYLLSVVMYIKGRLATNHNSPFPPLILRGGGEAGGVNWGSSFCYLLSLLSAVLAMKTKEISFTLPLIVVLYEFLFFSAPLKKRLPFIVPVLLLLILIPLTIMGANRSLGELLSDVTNMTRVQTNIPRTDYFLTELTVVSTYIRLIFLPINQNFDYDYPIYHSFLTPRVVLSFLFLLTLFGTAVWLLYRSRQGSRGSQQSAASDQQDAIGGHNSPFPPLILRGGADRLGRSAGAEGGGVTLEGNHGGIAPTIHDSRSSDDSRFTFHVSRLIGFGILWFFITLSVESSFIPIEDVIFEHRVYLPSVGAFIALAAFCALIVRRIGAGRQKMVLTFCALAIVVLAAATVMRNAVWRSEVVLWEDVVKKSPRKTRGLHTLAGLYLRAGRLEEAKSLLRELSEMTFESRDAKEGYFLDVGALNSETGAWDEAEAALGKALEVNKDSFQAYTDLCSLYIKKKQVQEAFDACNNALRIIPSYPPALNNLSAAYRKFGKIDEAIRSAETALIYDPEYALPHNNLGLAYVQQKRLAEAAAEFRKALLLEPGFVEAYNNLAGTYMTSGDYASAIGELRKALEINPNYVPSHYNLGVAYYVSGNRDEAMKELAILQSMSPGNADALTAFMQQKQGELPQR